MASEHIQPTLSVRDILANVAFYRDVLGFEFQGYWDSATNQAVDSWPHEEPPAYAEVRKGDARIGFVPATDDVPPSGLELSLHVDDIEGFHELLKERGGSPGELVSQAWGPKTFDITDPSGFRWKFLGPH